MATAHPVKPPRGLDLARLVAFSTNQETDLGKSFLAPLSYPLAQDTTPLYIFKLSGAAVMDKHSNSILQGCQHESICGDCDP